MNRMHRGQMSNLEAEPTANHLFSSDLYASRNQRGRSLARPRPGAWRCSVLQFQIQEPGRPARLMLLTTDAQAEMVDAPQPESKKSA